MGTTLTKCQKCVVGRFDEAGNCKYCMAMQQKVNSGRTDMKQPLRQYLIVTVVVLGGAYLFRAVVFMQSYSLWTDLQKGNATAVSRYDGLAMQSQLAVLVIIGALFLHNRAYSRWLHAGHANAMTRADIGLRWAHVVPGAALYKVWRRAWFVTVYGSLILAVVLRANLSDLDGMRRWDVVQIAASAVLLVVIAGYALSARRLTAELNTWLATPPPPAAVEAEPSPEPIG